MSFIKNYKNEILENAFSYIVVLAMFAYGFGKLVQFNGATDLQIKVSEMTGMQLMWAFYGYSKPFIYIVGALEILGGLLLLFKRTRLIGCFFITTILVNIILQDIFYNVNIGALRAAILYQVLVIVILYINKTKVLAIGRLFVSTKKTNDKLKNKLIVVILSVILFILLRIIEYFITTKL